MNLEKDVTETKNLVSKILNQKRLAKEKPGWLMSFVVWFAVFLFLCFTGGGVVIYSFNSTSAERFFSDVSATQSFFVNFVVIVALIYRWRHVFLNTREWLRKHCYCYYCCCYCCFDDDENQPKKLTLLTTENLKEYSVETLVDTILRFVADDYLSYNVEDRERKFKLLLETSDVV